MSAHLVGTAEIAQMLGVSRQRVDQLAAAHNDFPFPEAELAAGRIWSRAAVETWLALHPERKPGRPADGGISFERYTDRARQVLLLAQAEAKSLNHGYLGCEHIVLGLIREGTGLGGRALAALAIGAGDARTALLQLVGPGAAPPKDHLPFTPRATSALRLAREVSLEIGHNYVGTEHVLLGVLREADNVGCQLLVRAGVDLERLRLKVLEMMGFPQPWEQDEPANALVRDVLRRLNAIDERLSRIESAGR